MGKTVKDAPAGGVNEYLRSLPAPMRSLLQKVRQSIKDAAPKAEEVISYRIPTYRHLGPLIHFAAFKDHCSLVVISKSILTSFKKELEGHKVSGTTIHFTPENPLPSNLIKKIVRIRIKENEELDALKKISNKGRR